MQLKLLLDGVVQQTTVLLARLSTVSGARSPLGHLADQVFRDLARELEAQGVRKVVVADMFGLALRSYQRKTQRLVESASAQSRTLWEAVYDFVRSAEATRARIEERFKHDGERELSAVLLDLVRSGFLYTTGSGANAVYGATSERVRSFSQRAQDLDALAHHVWLKVFHRDVTTLAELESVLNLNAVQAAAVVAELQREGRVTESEGRLEAVNVVIPVGANDGVEAALLDHFRAVTTVLAERATQGSDPEQRTGGSTYSFRLDPGHPEFDSVVGLLQQVRSETQLLWERVMAINEAAPPSQEALKVTFYIGQTIAQPGAAALDSTEEIEDA
jgi:hypothetical protein